MRALLAAAALLASSAALALDETHVLPHYWINSSHNTYLTQGQLAGTANSNACMYTRFLEEAHGGCFEIDPTGVASTRQGAEEVHVSHQYTAINNIPLSSVLTNALHYMQQHPQSLPVIISWDNKILFRRDEHAAVWGVIDRTLYTDGQGHKCYQNGNCPWYLDPNNATRAHSDQCPTCGGLHQIKLADLRGKLLHKWDQCNTVQKKMTKTEGNRFVCGNADPDPEDDDTDIPEAREMKSESFKTSKGITPPSWEQAAYTAVVDNPGKVYTGNARWVHFTKTSKKLHEELQPDAVAGQIVSLVDGSSKTAGFHYAAASPHVVKNLSRNFMRIYPPFNLRAGSSPNYPQLKYWLSGVQMVAINFQTQDRALEINRAMFKDGPYRLKPAWMLDDHVEWPKLHELTLETNDIALELHHPSGEGDAHPVGGAKKAVFANVDVTLPIVYVTRLDPQDGGKPGKFTGAIEIPWDKDHLEGDVEVTLNLWDRQTASDFIPANCQYRSRAHVTRRLHYKWKRTSQPAVANH
jgi:phosphatidylinositol phospholipase C beta